MQFQVTYLLFVLISLIDDWSGANWTLQRKKKSAYFRDGVYLSVAAEFLVKGQRCVFIWEIKTCCKEHWSLLSTQHLTGQNNKSLAVKQQKLVWNNPVFGFRCLCSLDTHLCVSYLLYLALDKEYHTCALTSSVGNVAAEELLPLLAMHQGWTLEQQCRSQDVAGDGGEDVDGGAHGCWAQWWGRWMEEWRARVRDAAGIRIKRCLYCLCCNMCKTYREFKFRFSPSLQ